MVGQISDLICKHFFGPQTHLAKLLPLVAIFSTAASRHAIQDMVGFRLDAPAPGTRPLLARELGARACGIISVFTFYFLFKTDSPTAAHRAGWGTEAADLNLKVKVRCPPVFRGIRP